MDERPATPDTDPPGGRTAVGDAAARASAPSPARRVLSRAYAGYARRVRDPFADPSFRPLIVHCAHHKVGTVWFRRILLDVARHYGLRYEKGGERAVDPAAGVVLYEDAARWAAERAGGRPFRGSHVVRDPRDLVVSGYEYHLRTGEAWAQRPDARYGGVGYQEHLRRLPEHQGLIAEIEWQAGGPLRAMAGWDYGQPGFLELRLEDVVADETGSFSRLFAWYGLSPAAVSVGLEAAARSSLRRGGAGSGHARGGRPGEWRDRLDADHLRLLDELTGGLVARLGYPTADPR